MKRIVIMCLVFLVSFALYAGDIASFANLGFSDDSRYFMFGVYGIADDGAGQYAELYLVDVPGNRFASGGSNKAVYDEPAMPGQDGFGALITLYRDSIDRTKRYRINHLRSGRLLYVLVDGDTPKPVLTFRDFETGRNYRVELLQSTFGAGESVSASFHINLTVTASDGAETYHTVGIPDYRRAGVRSYRIRWILSSPDDKSLVFVVEREQYADVGVNVRYMVETVQLH